VAVLLDVVVAQARDHVLEIGLVCESRTVAVHHDGVLTEHLADADDADQCFLARTFALNPRNTARL
jgi:hypothetical protein